MDARVKAEKLKRKDQDPTLHIKGPTHEHPHNGTSKSSVRAFSLLFPSLPMLTHLNSLLREAKCSRPLHQSKVVLCRKNHHLTTSFPYQASGATTSSVECVSDNKQRRFMSLQIFGSSRLVDVEVLRDETRTPCPDPEVRVALIYLGLFGSDRPVRVVSD